MLSSIVDSGTARTVFKNDAPRGDDIMRCHSFCTLILTTMLSILTSYKHVMYCIHHTLFDHSIKFIFFLTQLLEKIQRIE